MAAPCPSAEVHFAQKLAANEKRTRDIAFKKLKKWLQSRTSDGKEADFLKIWKGLHYCMWMQDKPLIQEELSDNICKLVHVFGNVDISLLFLGVFFQTESREWSGIDRWRMDKFMMLSREMLGQGLALLKKAKWKKKYIELFCQILKKQVLMAENDGYKIHITDIYLDEIAKAGATVLTSSQIVDFLEPFSTYLAESNNTTLVKRVISRVFEAIIQQTVDDAKRRAERLIQKEDEENNNGADEEDSDEEDDTPPRLNFDYGAIADRLFELGKSPGCLSRHRTLIYNVVKKFRDLNEGVLPVKEKDYSDLNKGYINREEFAQSVNKLISMETEVQRRKKKSQKRKKNRQKVLENNDEPDPKKIKKDNTTPDTGKQGTEVKAKAEGVINGKTKKEKGLTKLKDKLLGKRKKETLSSSEPSKKSKQAESISATGSVDTPVHGSNIMSNKTPTSIKNSNKKEAAVLSVSSSSKKARTSQLTRSGMKDFDTPEFEEGESSSVNSNKKKTPVHKHVGLDTLELKHIHDQEGSHKKDVKKDTLEEEVEIWVPNKKYSGKLKGIQEQLQKSTEGKKFAQFEHGVHTPPAFIRRSLAKVAAPNTDPGKASKRILESDAGSRTSKRKVTFDMKKNKAVDFKKSIQFSPAPYNPNKKPEQGILKTPDSVSQKTQKSNVTIATPDGVKSVSSQKILRQATPHVKKVRAVQRTPSSVKKLRTPVSSKKYTGTPVPTKNTPVMSLKSTPRSKAADFF